ncbi:HNH endonuclease [Stenotrophomonas acidaminiphila]
MWNGAHLKAFAAIASIGKRQAKERRCTAEHLQARCDGGSNSRGNIAAACWYCNQQRHRLPVPPDSKAYAEYVQREVLAGRWRTVRHGHATS